VSGDGFLHVREIDAEALALDDEFLEFMFEEFCFFGFGGGRALGDNGNRARASFEETGVDEAGDYFVGGVGIDFELPAEGADGGKFVTRAELAGDDGLRGGIDNLLVNGGAGFEVHVEGDHGGVLYHVGQLAQGDFVERNAEERREDSDYAIRGLERAKRHSGEWRSRGQTREPGWRHGIGRQCVSRHEKARVLKTRRYRGGRKTTQEKANRGGIPHFADSVRNGGVVVGLGEVVLAGG
jgi:hypothetical protein